MWNKVLSNFYPVKITFNGFTYNSVEAAFQAQKCPERAVEFCNLDPKTAKRLGKRVSLRPNWDSIKNDIMYQLLLLKFSNPHLKQQLKATIPHELVERNPWHDTYWGTDMNGVGKNVLGQLLMLIRDQL